LFVGRLECGDESVKEVASKYGTSLPREAISFSWFRNFEIIFFKKEKEKKINSLEPAAAVQQSRRRLKQQERGSSHLALPPEQRPSAFL